MPLGLDPDQTAPVSLKSDQPKPEASRPAFLFKYLTERELTQVQQLREQARDEQDNEKCLALLKQGIGVGLRGWKNMIGLDGKPISYDAGKLGEILTIQEQWELINDYPTALQIAASLKADFPSPSPSPSANSATGSAEAVDPTAKPASAPTGRRSRSRST